MFLIFFRFEPLNVLKVFLNRHRESTIKLDVLMFYKSEADIVLRLFLISKGFEPRCSYKIVLI